MNTQLAYISSMTPTAILWTSIIIRFVIGWRRFKRRGVGGLQHYPNYVTAIVTQFIEWVLRWTANGMILYALLKIMFTKG